jgi:leucine-rich repeat-containing G protein-coupled receptor 5
MTHHPYVYVFGFVPLLYRIIEMPSAYQCCAFGGCENVYKISNQWNKDDGNSVDDLHKKDAGLFQVQGKN